MAVTVHGEAMSREAVRFSVRGKSYTLAEMEMVYVNCWNFGEKVRITELKDGRLSVGPYAIDVAVRMRVSFLPFLPATKGGCELRMVV